MSRRSSIEKENMNQDSHMAESLNAMNATRIVGRFPSSLEDLQTRTLSNSLYAHLRSRLATPRSLLANMKTKLTTAALGDQPLRQAGIGMAAFSSDLTMLETTSEQLNSSFSLGLVAIKHEITTFTYFNKATLVITVSSTTASTLTHLCRLWLCRL